MKENSVIDLLENHSKLKARTNMLKGRNIPSQVKEELEMIANDLELLEICIMGLESENRQLIRMYYFEGFSGRQLASELCMCKTTIYEKKNKIVAELEENFRLLKKTDSNGQK